jgi:hypothetical protein
MPQQLLHGAQIRSPTQQMGRKTVSQFVRREGWIQPGFRQIPFQIPLKNPRAQPFPTGAEKSRSSFPPPIRR